MALPLNERLVFGLAVNTPFGLKTDYDDPWIGRFQGIKSELRTINVNPALSWKLNDTVALGFGANFQRADAELTNAVMLGAATEGRANIDVDDDAWGWNAGVLFTLPSATRIGASYRSELEYSARWRHDCHHADRPSGRDGERAHDASTSRSRIPPS